MALSRAQIIDAQNKLNGWWEVTPKLKVDGEIGAQTIRGIGQFQKRVGLPVTGKFDDATLARLGVQATNASGNPNSGFFQWSLEARKQQDALDAFIRSIDPFSKDFQPLRQQAEALKQVAAQTETRAAQAASGGAQSDPALVAQLAQLQAAVAALTGKDKPKEDYSKYFIYGGLLLVVMFAMRD